MRKKGKIVSIVLSVIMLMQIFAVTSFAAQAPTNVHWAKDGVVLDKLSDRELVFNLVDGHDLYKMTLYKDNVEIYSYFAGCGSDDGIFYEDMIEALEYAGAGSYTATVGVVKESYNEWYMMEDEVLTVLATSEMSDVLVWNGDNSTSKNDATSDIETNDTVKETTTTQNKTQTTSKKEGKKIEIKKTVAITDLYNNELFEVVAEQDDAQVDTPTPNDIAPTTYYKILGYGTIGQYTAETAKKSSNYRWGLIYKDSTTNEGENIVAGMYDIDGNRLCTEKGTSLYNFQEGYALYENGNVSKSIFDYVNGIHYTLPEDMVITQFNHYAEDCAYIFNAKRVKFYIEQRPLQPTDFELYKVYKVKLKKYPMVLVKYDNKTIHFDQNPIIDNGRTLVPLRAIFEKIGATVEWDGNTQTVKATKGDTSISLTINNTTAYKNGQPITLDVPAKILNGRTLVPVRFVADCFGVDVDWVQEKQTVILTSK